MIVGADSGGGRGFEVVVVAESGTIGAAGSWGWRGGT